MVEGTVSDSCAMPDSGVSFLRIVTKTRAGDDVEVGVATNDYTDLVAAYAKKETRVKVVAEMTVGGLRALHVAFPDIGKEG
jgi:hypothetical protein